jgi:hypothetical protein
LAPSPNAGRSTSDLLIRANLNKSSSNHTHEDIKVFESQDKQEFMDELQDVYSSYINDKKPQIKLKIDICFNK